LGLINGGYYAGSRRGRQRTAFFSIEPESRGSIYTPYADLNRCSRTPKLVEAIEIRKIERPGGLDFRGLSRELCSKRYMAIEVRVTDQRVLDRLLKALIREGISVFAADNRDDVVRLYITKRDKEGC